MPLSNAASTHLMPTDTPHVCIRRFPQREIAYHDDKAMRDVTCGELYNRMTSMLLRYLEDEGAPSDYLDIVNTHEMRVREVQAFGFRAVVRNIVSQDFAQRLGVKEGRRLAHAVLAWQLNDSARGFPWVNDAHLRYVLDLATDADLQEIRRQAHQINERLKTFWTACGLECVDVTLEFGRTVDGQIVLSGVLTPETQTIWFHDDEAVGYNMFRRDLGDLSTTYRALYEHMIRSWPTYDAGELAEASPDA